MKKNNKTQNEGNYTLELKLNPEGCCICGNLRYKPYYSKPVPSLSDRARMATEGIRAITKYRENHLAHPKLVKVILHDYGICSIIRN